jgi:dihydrofolate synthase/folylpolyglutamate synthase
MPPSDPFDPDDSSDPQDPSDPDGWPDPGGPSDPEEDPFAPSGEPSRSPQPSDSDGSPEPGLLPDPDDPELDEADPNEPDVPSPAPYAVPASYGASYDEAVAGLSARGPGRMVPDLDRIKTLCGLLGQPEAAYPSIRLTGTNGKSTTAAMTGCLLSAIELTPGVYTSPHLQELRERFRIAAEPISRDDFAASFAELAPYLAEVDERHAEPVTYFEALTGLAFAVFADAPVDVGVFEVGMGGLWDATNVARGEVAAFTPIDVDHELLGSTPAEIAAEKVGVVKDDSVVVTAEQRPEVADVIAEAAQARADRIVVAGRDFGVAEHELAVGGQHLRLNGVTDEFDDIYLPLHGAHQAANAAVALASVEALLGFEGGLDAELVRAGFAAVRAPGRLEVVRRQDYPPVVLDCAHNPAGCAALARALTEEFTYQRRVLVLGAMADKDLDGIAAALTDVADHVVAAAAPSPRAATADELAKPLSAAGFSVETADSVEGALADASELVRAEDAVVVAGSFATVGAARTALGLPPA